MKTILFAACLLIALLTVGGLWFLTIAIYLREGANMATGWAWAAGVVSAIFALVGGLFAAELD